MSKHKSMLFILGLGAFFFGYSYTSAQLSPKTDFTYQEPVQMENAVPRKLAISYPASTKPVDMNPVTKTKEMDSYMIMIQEFRKDMEIFKAIVFQQNKKIQKLELEIKKLRKQEKIKKD